MFSLSNINMTYIVLMSWKIYTEVLASDKIKSYFKGVSPQKIIYEILNQCIMVIAVNWLDILKCQKVQLWQWWWFKKLHSGKTNPEILKFSTSK